MAQPNTQDTQKVFQSALEKFDQFSGGVEGVKSSSMQVMYDNMAKLFETFTRGCLTGQGANSEILLRTIYRSLASDFIDIIRDSRAVDLIADAIKDKQDALEQSDPQDVENAMVSSTTKKVVTHTLEPNDCDIMSVVLDFVDELQTAILQVKLNLSREYDRQKLARAHSSEGQQEDLDRLNGILEEQSRLNGEVLAEMAQEGDAWSNDHILEIENLLGKFGTSVNSREKYTSALSDLQGTLKSFSDAHAQSSPLTSAPKFNLEKFIDRIKGELPSESDAAVSAESHHRVTNVVTVDRPQVKSETPEVPQAAGGGTYPDGPARETGIDLRQRNSKGEKAYTHTQGVKNQGIVLGKADSVDDGMKPLAIGEDKTQAKNRVVKPTDAAAGLKKMSVPIRAPIPNMLPQIKSADAGPKVPIGVTAPKKQQANVRSDKPLLCSICGQPIFYGKTQPRQSATSQVPEPPTASSQPSSGLTRNGVLNAIGQARRGVFDVLKTPKFRSAFMIDYTRLQKGTFKQLNAIEDDEQQAQGDLRKTEQWILVSKKKRSRSLILQLMNPKGLLFTVVGALILITLTRAAFARWKKKYVPEPDGSRLTVFGIPITGWDSIKSYGLGVWNFITVGLPNVFNRLQVFFKSVNKALFGKRGAFRNIKWVRHTLRRLLLAWLIGQKAVGKVGGLFMKAFGFLISFIPYVGPIGKFIMKFSEVLFKFIATQVMLLWSKRKAEGELEAEAQSKALKFTGKSILSKITNNLMQASKDVHPYKHQKDNIPGLQSAMPTGSGRRNRIPKPSAIMRSVPMKSHKTFGLVKDVEKQKISSESKQKMMERVDERLKKGNQNDLLVLIHEQHAAFKADFQNRLEQQGLEDKQYSSWWNVEKRQAVENARAAALRDSYGKLLIPQIVTLNNYIRRLRSSTRFSSVKGPLYNPERGWNPGYRITSADLRTIIPTTPFEKLRPQADIFIGQPMEQEYSSDGYMPFTWIQGGTPICANPLLYEIARATAIRDMYKEIVYANYGKKGEGVADDKNDLWSKDINSALKKFAKDWEKWNSAVNQGEKYKRYGIERDDVLFGNHFHRFIEKLRAGKVTNQENTFAGSFNRKVMAGWMRESDTINYNMGLAKPSKISPAQRARMLRERKSKMLDTYDRVKTFAGETPEEREKMRKRKHEWAQRRLAEWKDVEFNDLKYGDVRNLMVDEGLLDLFQSSNILASVSTAAPILDWFISHKRIPRAKSPPKDAPNIYHLISAFFDYARISGYNGDCDAPTYAGFAQSFLEYLRYVVLPQWNLCEKLLSDDITYKTKDTRKKMKEGLQKLHGMLDDSSVFEFMKDHLRFPNMKVKVIDYANANFAQRLVLDAYRAKQGIPTARQKSSILKDWRGRWGKISDMSDKELQDSIDRIRQQVKNSEFEARYTGENEFVEQLRKYHDALEKERQSRLARQASGNKIVKKPGGVQTQIVEPPPRTMEEIEAERRRREEEQKRKEREEERKRQEEKEKRLKEEAKRKEELVVAEAIKKQAEAIKREEESYENVLAKLISNPGKVTDKDLASIGDKVSQIKQEAENRIAKLPREERELKLALIRGDKISQKTFQEMKITATGLHGSLQGYMEEVKKIPVGSVIAIQNTGGADHSVKIPSLDSDSVDMGDE